MIVLYILGIERRIRTIGSRKGRSREHRQMKGEENMFSLRIGVVDFVQFNTNGVRPRLERIFGITIKNKQVISTL